MAAGVKLPHLRGVEVVVGHEGRVRGGLLRPVPMEARVEHLPQHRRATKRHPSWALRLCEPAGRGIRSSRESASRRRAHHVAAGGHRAGARTHVVVAGRVPAPGALRQLLRQTL
eukprot:scaffold5595_cov220-Prasinococcus_capsulatus_cf.AAC.1